MDWDDYISRKRRSSQEFPWLVVIIGLLVLGAISYFSLRGHKPAPQPPVEVNVPKPPPLPAQTQAPVVQHPVPTVQPAPEPVTPPLPTLDKSDPTVLDALNGFLGTQAVQRFLVSTDIIRNIVVTVDNLPRKKLSSRVWPVQRTPGQFQVNGKDNSFTISPDNAARYQPFMDLVKSVNATKIAALYLRFYPLFQQAYEELGYPKSYFNDRLVEVIDHLLATPDVKGPIALVRPSVYYQYSDPDLEGRSAGQKILIRLGSDNAAIIKSRLREFRKAIVIPEAH